MSIDNRRKFLLEFATKKGFDPLIPENWKNVTAREIRKQVIKSGETVNKFIYKINLCRDVDYWSIITIFAKL